MAVRYRYMGVADIPRCVAGIAAHPVLGARYGKLIERLPAALRSAFGQDSLIAAIFEELRGSDLRFLGAGLAVFVTDEFLQELKTTPSFSAGPELVERITRGASPLLSNAAVRTANSTVGLNLMVWHNTVYPEDLRRPELAMAMMAAFDDHFRGFRLKELIGQADCVEHFWGMCNSGGRKYDRPKNLYTEVSPDGVQALGSEPMYVGMTRELAMSITMLWVGSLFLYAKPQFCFARSEQRLLALALEGGTDEELSYELGISLFAVKKAWRAIYDRVAMCQPDLIPNASRADGLMQDRGRQKKQRLLAYLRKHPEELRPVSRKLLKQDAPGISEIA